MNQKSKGFVLIVIACLWMWGGCDGVSRENDAAYETAKVLKEGYETGIEETTEGSVQDREKNCFEKTFGSYELPKDWIESEEHSTAERFFYVKTGDAFSTDFRRRGCDPLRGGLHSGRRIDGLSFYH